MAESGTWRNAYLCAAQELRYGTNTDPATRSSGSNDAIAHMTPEMILDYIGILADTASLSDLTFTANIILPDENYTLHVKNGVVLYQKDCLADNPDVTWTTTRMGLLSIVQKNPEIMAKAISQKGNTSCLERLSGAIINTSDFRFFNIIEP